MLVRFRGGEYDEVTGGGTMNRGGDKKVSVLETDRLRLCRFTVDDADFILDLLNQPSFLRFIGYKGVRTREDARRYILDGPVASYKENGFGLYLVELKRSGEEIGMKYERMVRLSEDEPEIKLFSVVF